MKPDGKNPTCKMQKPYVLVSKIRQTLEGGRLNQKEPISFWSEVKITNGIWIIKLGSESSLKLAQIY
jgi:hypothetical protein